MLLIYICIYMYNKIQKYVYIYNYNFKLVIRNSFVSQHSSILHLKFNGVTHIFILIIDIYQIQDSKKKFIPYKGSFTT